MKFPTQHKVKESWDSSAVDESVAQSTLLPRKAAYKSAFLASRSLHRVETHTTAERGRAIGAYKRLGRTRRVRLVDKEWLISFPSLLQFGEGFVEFAHSSVQNCFGSIIEVIVAVWVEQEGNIFLGLG